MKKFLKKILILVIIVVGFQVLLGKPPEGVKENLKALSVRSITRRRVLAIDNAAWHMGTHFAFCKYIAQSGKKPDTIIISINPSSFGPTWYQRPMYEFKKEIFYLSAGPARIFLKPLRIFKLIKNRLTEEQFNQSPVYCDDKVVGIIRDYDCTNAKVTHEMIRRTLIMHYMEPLKPDHQRLKEMTRIVDILRELDINLIFYITPVNIQKGDAYLPGKFHERVSANTAVIKTVLQKHGVDVLDLSTSLPDAYFSRDVYPNAHLAQQGRLFVAQNLSKILIQNKPQAK